MQCKQRLLDALILLLALVIHARHRQAIITFGGFFDFVCFDRADSGIFGCGLDAGGPGKELVVIFARPAVERMIVALGAGDLRAEEECGGAFDVCGTVLAIAQVITSGRRTPAVTFGAEQLTRPHIEGFVVADALLDPCEVKISLHALGKFILRTQQIAPVVEHVADVAVGGEQLVNHATTLVGFLGAEEALRFIRCGDAAHEVEIDAAQPRGVVREWSRLLRMLGEVCFDQLVDACGHSLQLGNVHRFVLRRNRDLLGSSRGP